MNAGKGKEKCRRLLTWPTYSANNAPRDFLKLSSLSVSSWQFDARSFLTSERKRRKEKERHLCFECQECFVFIFFSVVRSSVTRIFLPPRRSKIKEKVAERELFPARVLYFFLSPILFLSVDGSLFVELEILVGTIVPSCSNDCLINNCQDEQWTRWQCPANVKQSRDEA